MLWKKNGEIITVASQIIDKVGGGGGGGTYTGIELGY